MIYKKIKFIGTNILLITTLGFLGLINYSALAKTNATNKTKILNPHCPNISQTISRRAKNNQVTELQKFLADYYHISPRIITTGHFGPLTQNYVSQLQKSHHIPPTGIVDAKTRAMIAKLCKLPTPPLPAKKPSAKITPKATPKINTKLNPMVLAPIPTTTSIGTNTLSVNIKPTTSSATTFATSTFSTSTQGSTTTQNTFSTIGSSGGSSNYCALNGTVVQNGGSATFYSAQNAQSTSSCASISQSRSCSNGTLSGSSIYQYTSCTNPTTLNVQDFGATGNGVADDATAINNAITHAAELGGARTVYLPAGTYRITTAVRPEVDNLTFKGDGRTSIILDDIGDGSVTTDRGIAILTNKTYTGTSTCSASQCFDMPGIIASPLVYINNLTLRDFDVYATLGKAQSSGGLISLNAAKNMLIDNIQIIGNNLLSGKRADGIGTSQGTSGIIQNVLVDHVSKTGIYISSWSHDLTVKNTIVKNGIDGAYGAGFGVVGYNITLDNNQAINNQGNGFIFQPVDITDPTNGKTGLAPHNVTVTNSTANGNASGFALESGYQNVSQNISFTNISADSSTNYGFIARAGTNVSVSSATFSHSGYSGIIADDNTNSLPTQPAPTGFTFSNINLTDNGLANISVNIGAVAVRGGPEFTMNNSTIHTSDSNSKQKYGFWFIALPSSATKNVTLQNISLTGLITNPVAYDATSSLPTLGTFDLHAAGSPVNRVAAPINSTYTNTDTATRYSKTSGYDESGWVQN